MRPSRALSVAAIAASVATFAPPPSNAAPSAVDCPADRYACAAAAYRAGDLAKARTEVAALLAERPDHSDGLLLSGNLALRDGDLRAARLALDRAATLAPGYADVLVARARLNLREGMRDAARRDARRALAISPRDAEAAALRDRIDAQDDVDVDAPRWTAAIDQTVSRLSSGGRPTWYETAAALSRRRGNAALSLEVEHARRFDTSDLRFQLRADRTFASGSAYAAVVATPDSDFRESWGLRAGGVRALDANFDVLIDGRVSDYRGAVSGSLTMGGRYWTDDRRSSIRGALINYVDEGGRYRTGGAGHVSHLLTSRLSAALGYARYPETEAGTTQRVDLASASASYRINDALNLRAGLEREARRDAYTRTGASVGLSAGF